MGILCCQKKLKIPNFSRAESGKIDEETKTYVEMVCTKLRNIKLFLCSFDRLFFVRYAFNTKGFMFLNLVQTISTYVLVSSSILPLSGLENLGIFNFFGNTKSPSFFSPSTALYSVLLICCWTFSHSVFSTD